jgi:uncharacterized protein YecA (UPF0149 family)
MSGLHQVGRTTEADWESDPSTEREIGEILELLPADVCQELNGGSIDPHDPAFLEGLADHVARLALADPKRGRQVLSKLIRLKKRIRRDLREGGSEVLESATVTRAAPRVGRNDPCPCGSGRKFKQCCRRG